MSNDELIERKEVKIPPEIQEKIQDLEIRRLKEEKTITIERITQMVNKIKDLRKTLEIIINP